MCYLVTAEGGGGGETAHTHIISHLARLIATMNGAKHRFGLMQRTSFELHVFDRYESSGDKYALSVHPDVW